MNYNAAGVSGSSPSNMGGVQGTTSPSARSGSANFASIFAQQQTGSGNSPKSVGGGSSNRASVDTSAAQRTGAAPFVDGGDTAHPHGARGDVDSDTEDAALVLEGLAMGARGECGEKKTLKPERAALEIIERAPVKSIQGFVEEDRAEDIMTEGKYRYDKKEDQSLKGAKASECSKDPKNTAECEALRAFLKANPDAEFGPDGQRLSPAKKACVLLSEHSSLFNLVWGPETFLGWGLGWAFPAAEAAGDMMSVSEIVGCKGALQREAVLRAIIRSLPQREVAEHLVDVFDDRVKFLAGNCFHMPTFRKEMGALYDLDTVEKRARVINFVDPAWLSLMLMIFVLALHFHPCERPDTVKHLFDGRTIHLWRSAARTCLVLARYQSSTSMAVLQTIILINLLAMGTGKENFSLTHTAISNALEMGLHRLGDKDKQPKAGENPAIAIRREMAKRIWHQLTFTDWCSAPLHAGAYRIHPHQFNTPLPGNYNDDDLCQSPQPAPRPDSEHTHMSYALSMLKLADVSRQNIDMLHASESKRIMCADMAYLDTTYRGLLEQAPAFFKIGSSEGEGENIEVERWLFQQSVFHKLLRLHRPQLSSRTSARTSCVLLARSILDMQRRIRSRCSVVDRLFVNLAQSFSAAIVLCLDLLQTRPSAMMRDIVRGEIFEALKALRHVGASHHTTENSIRVIEALLEEEESRWNSPQKDVAQPAHGSKRRRNESDAARSGERRKGMLNLALRVAKAAQGEDGEGSTGEQEQASSVSGSHDEPLDAKAIEQQKKDQKSRQIFEQLFAGQPTFTEPQSFDTSRFHPTVYDGQNATVAPNGLDFGTGWTPPDGSGGQQFDLSKFLSEVETNSSPGNEYANSSAASDSGHSSLHGGRAGSTSSSGRQSYSSSFSQQNGHATRSSRQQQGSGAANSPVDPFKPAANLSPSAFEQPSTGLDGFWNWVLTQGAMQVGTSTENQAAAMPLGGNGSTVQNFNGNNPQIVGSVPPLPEQQTHFVDALAQNMAGGMGANPVSLSNTDGLQSNANAVPNPFAALTSRATATNTISASNNNQDVPFYSVGTPSAGVGSSWMSTPGLFDLALEFGDGVSGSQSSVLGTGNGISAT
jgi:hypothetical protein